MDSINLRLIDFKVNDNSFTEDFNINMYGIDSDRNTFSIKVNNFCPFIYILVGDSWTNKKTDDFINHLKKDDNVGKTCKQYITDYKLVEKKKLYGFDQGKLHKFVYISCKNIKFIHKIKTMYYDKITQKINNGYYFDGTTTRLYESFIPPLLRLFHIQEISPSGWITITQYTTTVGTKKTNCKYELICDYTHIIPYECEDIVPYKICSYDIEANSSHGDFPEPIKDYKKVSYDMVHYLMADDICEDDYQYYITELLKNVFGFKDTLDIDKCYPIEPYSQTLFETHLDKLFKANISSTKKVETKLKKYFTENGKSPKLNKVKNPDIISLLLDESIDIVSTIAYVLDKFDLIFPELKGDQVTFIGSTFVNYGEEKPYLNHCICLNKTTKLVEDQTIVCYDNEVDVLVNWAKLIKEEDPDIIIGYNIFGFDYPFMYDRATQLDCVKEFMNLGRTHTYSEEMIEKSVKSVMGNRTLRMIDITGRLQIDMYDYMQKEYILSSYKLDFVAGYLISDKVKDYKNSESDENSYKTCNIYTDNLKGLELFSFVCFEILNHSSEMYMDGKKFKLIEFIDDGFIIEGHINITDKFNWQLSKDDITPKDIFEMTNKGANERGLIAKYCIQDCNLVQQIFQKVDVLTSFIEMSALCSVPINFLVMRGQGIKLTSYVSKKCREKNTLMPLISIGRESDGYEGAIVLEPKCALYLDNPVACVDYSSLYPSSIISENISHDTKVWVKEYDLEGLPKKYKNGNEIIKGVRDEDGSFKYDNLKDHTYIDIKCNTYYNEHVGSTFKKKLNGYKLCRYAQLPNNEKGIMPSILQELLKARKYTKLLMKLENDPFKKNIYDKRQNSIKLTANSLYGQTGAKTSSFYDLDIAASTTSIGKKLLIYGKKIIEEVYGDIIVDTSQGKVKSNARYVYGDTDSVFFTFNFQDLDGVPIRNKRALELTIEMAKEAGHIASMFLKDPHDLEYEKTFMPFCLLSKKRYVGILYENDINKGYRKSMGIVLKRRDNAPIVKDVYGGIIDILMKEQDIGKSIEFLKSILDKLSAKQVNIDKLIISKSLRSIYKKPDQIAHAVLAKRIGYREPGNKPSAGDRIPYVYIINTKATLQGERIETPTFINKENLKIDYVHYITNQIMKPVIQIYSLVLYDMKEFRRRKPSFLQELKTIKENVSHEKYLEKEQKLKDAEVTKIIFEKYIRIGNNIKQNNNMITSFFKQT